MNRECDQNGMCPFWNVLKMEYVLFGICSFRNVPSLDCAEYAQDGMFLLWNVLFLGCALYETCSFWDVLYLNDGM